MAEQLDVVDFALAAMRHDGEWRVAELAHDLVADVPTLVAALRRFPGDAVGMVGMDEDFFLLIRVADHHARLLLSDVTAAEEWELASSAVEYLGLPQPDDDEDQVPAGDLDLLSDLGVSAVDLGVLLEDADSYPDELLSDVARQLGFGELFDDAVGLTSA